MESFLRLGLAEPLASALASFGFSAPTPVQAAAIPLLLARHDAVIESETGTGKTFAYLAPALQLVSVLERRQAGEPGVIVAAPTQELAVQIGREADRLARAAGLATKTAVLLGGTPMEKQAARLRDKPDIVVGTTGRLADLVAARVLRTVSLKLLVLDEADRLFAPETEDLARALLSSAPPSCARILASATIPDRVRREAAPFLRDAAEVSPGGEGVLSGDIEHWCFYCDGRKRLDFARRFEAAVHPDRCLIFMSSAARIEKAALALAKLGLPVEGIHAGLDKESRRVALERFAEGRLRYLLTSDLGARGLDIPGVSHVLSLDLPEDPTVYTHRAGRTGRAGAKGVSVALADGVELARASRIATRGGFVFRCKFLERGEVLEPTSEEFFAAATAAEDDRLARKAARVADGARREGPARRGAGLARSKAMPGDEERGTRDGRARGSRNEAAGAQRPDRGPRTRDTSETRRPAPGPAGAHRPDRGPRTRDPSGSPRMTRDSTGSDRPFRGPATGRKAGREGDSRPERGAPGGREGPARRGAGAPRRGEAPGEGERKTRAGRPQGDAYRADRRARPRDPSDARRPAPGPVGRARGARDSGGSPRSGSGRPFRGPSGAARGTRGPSGPSRGTRGRPGGPGGKRRPGASPDRPR